MPVHLKTLAIIGSVCSVFILLSANLMFNTELFETSDIFDFYGYGTAHCIRVIFKGLLYVAAPTMFLFGIGSALISLGLALVLAGDIATGLFANWLYDLFWRKYIESRPAEEEFEIPEKDLFLIVI